MTLVQTGARLHVSLLDLGRATSRAYGGTGFLITGPRTQVVAKRAANWHVESQNHLDSYAWQDLRLVIRRVARLSRLKAQVIVLTSAPQHLGLGSKTSLLLSVIAALNAELHLRLDKTQMQLLSGRGGTSGIGVHGFFSGGFVIDRGHTASAVRQYVPSRFQRPRHPPILALCRSLPRHWRFHLAVPVGSRPFTREEELAFFARATPLPAKEVHEAIAIVYHDLLSAVESGALSLLSSALRRIHSVGFKLRELRNQGRGVQRAFNRLAKSDEWAVGMSSMGPLIYVVTSSAIPAYEVRAEIERVGANYLGTYRGLNRREE